MRYDVSNREYNAQSGFHTEKLQQQINEFIVNASTHDIEEKNVRIMDQRSSWLEKYKKKQIHHQPTKIK